MKQRFQKSERLHNKRLIDHLFEKGNSFSEYPFRVFYAELTGQRQVPVQVLISVSKRSFRKATERNRVKRLVRESYRKNKEHLYHYRADHNGQLLIGLVYTARAILSYPEIERKIILILQRLIEQDEQAAG